MSLAVDVQLVLGSLELDVEFSVAAGEVLALLGPNGAGKSSTLRCLAGVVPLDGGSIELDDIVVDCPADDVLVAPEHRRVAMVFQDYLLFEHMSVIDNVAFGARARGATKADARRAASQWLARVGLSEHGARRPHSLSGGEAQRVALARALATNPRLLLLDEPLAALDAGARTLMRRDLGQHLSSFDGMTVLVTHDPVDAYALADRVAVVEGGRIVQVGSLAEVTAHPRSRYVADLVGMNLVSGVVRDHLLVTESGGEVVVADAQPGPSFAVIRPQAISLMREAPAGVSARNIWHGVVSDVDVLGERVRVSVAGPLPLTAEITAAALESMRLRPGDGLYLAVKATDIEVYPA